MTSTAQLRGRSRANHPTLRIMRRLAVESLLRAIAPDSLETADDGPEMRAHLSFRGRLMSVPITKIDGPTVDRLLRRLQVAATRWQY